MVAQLEPRYQESSDKPTSTLDRWLGCAVCSLRPRGGQPVGHKN